MSLTILVHRERSDVGIVRWFRDPKVDLIYSSGPLVQMSGEEFRRIGYDWVRRHFDEYATIRLTEEEAARVFIPGEERSFLEDCVAVWIRVEGTGHWKFIPQIFRKHTLADTENLAPEHRQVIASDSAPEVFWRTLDDAIAAAFAADE